MAALPLVHSNIEGFPCKRGKVRDVYDVGNDLVIVATDRISAFDWVLPTPIPDKGRVLTSLTCFWLNWLGVPNHLISTDIATFPPAFRSNIAQLEGRSMRVRKTTVFPIECVVRGYLSGSSWKEYRSSGTVCGLKLPAGLRESERFSEPIFTPATKAETGHDENISFETMSEIIGASAAEELKKRSMDIYQRAAEYARGRGAIIADTKFEWGRLPDGQIILIDEVLTPDSSRFWPLDRYEPGKSQPSFDKQYVRDYLESTTWDKNSEPPSLPANVVENTRLKYREALDRLTG
jgi:phosphoribosylaminoimidazole-succinocarboxamide synthase